MNKAYTGPLFIVGMPRSGTKLLRSLLNEHSKISIPNVETEFLPYWNRIWKDFGDLSNIDNFHNFYLKVNKQPFFIYLSESNIDINYKEWYQMCNSFNVAGVFEALIRYISKIPYGSPTIWGDKSPSYISRIGLLKKLYPNAKIIHIIRDVRDYCLSMRKTWGKNMYRAAQRWVEDINTARNEGLVIPEDYLEVRYEDILDNPDKECRKICKFLNLEFEPTMLELTTSPEKHGDTKGMKTVIRSNKTKYKNVINTRALRRIELISFKVLESLNYRVQNYGTKQRRIGSLEMNLYKIMDGIQLFRFRLKEKSIISSLKFQFQYFKLSNSKK